jgi:FkbM family methyltransferase
VRLSFRSDRADLVVDGLLRDVAVGRFIDAHAPDPALGSLTALLLRRGWQGLQVLPDEPASRNFQRANPNCRTEIAKIGAFDSAGFSTIPALCRRHFGNQPVELLCLGSAVQLPAVLLGLTATSPQPWVVCIEHVTPRLDQDCSQVLLDQAGYRLLFAGPTVDFWVLSDAPASVLSFSYAGAVVMPGPAMPVSLLPPALELDELLALDDERFVLAAYWSVLRRPADDAGKLHYEAALRQGRRRVEILRELAVSEEALAHNVGVGYRDLPIAEPPPTQPARRPWWRRLIGHGGLEAPRPLAKLRPAAASTVDAASAGNNEQQMDWPHYKISYAQNFEDLVLAGLLKSVSTGFYVDVGANHPELDSVTKIFYEKGWRGLNVEPNDDLHRLLEEQRPRDINVRAAASSQPGSLTLRIYDGLDGLSTISRDTQAVHAASLADRRFRDVQVPVVCLADLLSQHRPTGDIHFLKVDVEGLELEVLLGNDWRRFRPWVLCLERNLQSARQAAICTYLREMGYQAVFWDGINDFFVADERLEVWKSFSYANDVVMNGVPVNYIFVRTMAALARDAATRT